MKSILRNVVLLCGLSFLAVNTYADWKCYAVDQGGHTWASGGLTQEHAAAVALSFCSAYSPDSTTCHPSKCDNN